MKIFEFYLKIKANKLVNKKMSDNEHFPNSNQMSQGRSSNHQNDEDEFPQGQPYGQYGN